MQRRSFRVQPHGNYDTMVIYRFGDFDRPRVPAWYAVAMAASVDSVGVGSHPPSPPPAAQHPFPTYRGLHPGMLSSPTWKPFFSGCRWRLWTRTTRLSSDSITGSMTTPVCLPAALATVLWPSPKCADPCPLTHSPPPHPSLVRFLCLARFLLVIIDRQAAVFDPGLYRSRGRET